MPTTLPGDPATYAPSAAWYVDRVTVRTDALAQLGVPATTMDSQGKPRRYARDIARQMGEQIKAGGFNLDLKNPRKREEASGDVNELLSQFDALLNQIAQVRDTLNSELKKALSEGKR
jgi:hypothetical protein